MRIGAIATGIVTLSALSGIMFAFVSNSSPYVTVAQALKAPGDEVHIAGNIDKPTLKSDALHRLVTFDLTDDHGDRISVHYTGPPPANMGEAKQVVAKGKVEGSTLKADKLLLKCPSKYESEKQE